MKGKSQSEVNRAFELFYKAVDGKVDNMTSNNEASFKNAVKTHPTIKHWLVDVGDKGKVGMVE
jgi:hypothetical protein